MVLEIKSISKTAGPLILFLPLDFAFILAPLPKSLVHLGLSVAKTFLKLRQLYSVLHTYLLLP